MECGKARVALRAGSAADDGVAQGGAVQVEQPGFAHLGTPRLLSSTLETEI